MAHIHILNGPNLNLLGSRERAIYGTKTLADIEAQCRVTAQSYKLNISFTQSNEEGVLVGQIQAARNADGLIINAGAYTHTSIAIQDALQMLTIPIIEIHLSNIFARESYRAHSYISPLAHGIICGLGDNVYYLAISAIAHILETKNGGKNDPKTE